MALRFRRYKGDASRMAWEKFPAITYGHGPFPREHEFSRTKHTDALQFTPDRAELNLLLDAVMPAGIEPADITHLQPVAGRRVPDFEVTLVDGGKVFVECTRAGDQDVIRLEDKFPQIESRLNAWLYGSPEALGRLGGRYVAFFPRAMPPAESENAFVEEIQRFVLEEPLEEYRGPLGERVPPAYPVLLSVQTLALTTETPSPQIVVQIPAMSTGGPHEATALALAAIRAKRERGYDGFRPIWLAVGISNLQWKPSGIFDGVQKAIDDIEPFSRVFLCNSNESFEIRAADHD